MGINNIENYGAWTEVNAESCGTIKKESMFFFLIQGKFP